MSKKKVFNKIEELKRIQMEAQRELRKVAAECSHQKDSGKLTLVALDNKGHYKCKVCGAKFSMDVVDVHELEAASTIINDAIQQIRCFSDPDTDSIVIKRLGEMAFNLTELSTLYERMVESNMRGSGSGSNKNKNKNKPNKSDDWGSWGGSVSFIGNSRKK